MDNRRQFIGKMFAGAFGLTVGQTVNVQAIEAPKKIEPIPIIPTFPGQLWCHHADLRIEREPIDVDPIDGYRIAVPIDRIAPRSVSRPWVRGHVSTHHGPLLSGCGKGEGTV